MSCENLMWNVKRSVRLLSDARFPPTYRMELTHAVNLAINSLSIWNQGFPVLEQRRKNIVIFDSLMEQVWLGLSLVGLLIHQLYSQIYIVSTPVER